MATTYTLADLIKPVTREEAQAAIYAQLARVGISTTAWESGGVVRSIVTAASAMFAALSELQAELVRAGFLEYATAGWLRLVAFHVYGVTPIDATYATGNVQLTNTGGGLFEVDAGDLVVRNASTGKAYRNISAFTLGAGETITIAVIALEAGTPSNANSNAITQFVTTLSRVEVTNPAALMARDDESPAALRARCREKLGSLSPYGPWDAYSFAARSAALTTGESAGVTRTHIARDGYGNVYLTVASATGTVDGTEGDLASPLGAIDNAVQRMAAPLSVSAHVLSAVPVAQLVAYQAWANNASGLTADAIRQRVAAALQTFITEHPIGGAKIAPGDATGYLYAEALRAVIHNAVPEIFYVQMVTPAADVALSAAQVVVLLHDPTLHAAVNIVATNSASTVELT